MNPNSPLGTPTNDPRGANFTDPLLLQRVYAIDHVGISAFLVSLAAWQRGLKVTFHYEVFTQCERFADAAVQGFRGELFSVSDGQKTHFFRRTLGDLTSKEVSRLCDHKQATKDIWQAAGLPLAAGVALRAGQTQRAEAFMRQHPERLFVLKPNDGTLGEDVELELTPPSVLEKVRQLDQRLWLLEECITGRLYHYRVYLVAGRYAHAFMSRPASILGDGKHSIQALVEYKDQHRQHRPIYPDKHIRITDTEIAYLKNQGLTPQSVPAQGQRVFIRDSVFGTQGADRLDVGSSLDPKLIELAEKAAQALHIPNVGLDILYEENTNRMVLLEANQNAIITGHSFPMEGPSPGNLVAEALIDHYFPESTDNPRHPAASFDFMAVCRSLQSGLIGSVTLPVLGPDWAHQRLLLPKAQVSSTTSQEVSQACHTYGIHGQNLLLNDGSLLVELLAPRPQLETFLAAVKR